VRPASCGVRGLSGPGSSVRLRLRHGFVDAPVRLDRVVQLVGGAVPTVHLQRRVLRGGGSGGLGDAKVFRPVEGGGLHGAEC